MVACACSRANPFFLLIISLRCEQGRREHAVLEVKAQVPRRDPEPYPWQPFQGGSEELLCCALLLSKETENLPRTPLSPVGPLALELAPYPGSSCSRLAAPEPALHVAKARGED